MNEKEITLSQETEKREKKAKEREKKERVIYMGPTIEGVVSTNVVFSNGLPKELMELQTEYPYLKNLIVPIKNLRNAKKDVNLKDTAMDICYKKAETIKKGER